MPSASRVFPAQLKSVGEARRFLRATLSTWAAEDYEFGAPLVLGELATNAVLHARTPFTVRIRLEDGPLVVEVMDSDPRRPHRTGYGADATTGRGITLVDSLCVSWGVRAVDVGKVVWAQVPPDDTGALTIDPDTLLGLEGEARPAASNDRRADRRPRRDSAEGRWRRTVGCVRWAA